MFNICSINAKIPTFQAEEDQDINDNMDNKNKLNIQNKANKLSEINENVEINRNNQRNKPDAEICIFAAIERAKENGTFLPSYPTKAK